MHNRSKENTTEGYLVETERGELVAIIFVAVAIFVAIIVFILGLCLIWLKAYRARTGSFCGAGTTIFSVINAGQMMGLACFRVEEAISFRISNAVGAFFFLGAAICNGYICYKRFCIKKTRNE